MDYVCYFWYTEPYIYTQNIDINKCGAQRTAYKCSALGRQLSRHVEMT
jgi:hypothetical protein